MSTSALHVAGELLVPGDKSISHRSLICGALAEGTSRVRSILRSADVHSTARVLRALGVDIPALGDDITITGVGLLNRSQCLGEAAGFLRLRGRHNLVFQLGQCGEEFSSFKRFDDKGISPNPPRFVGLERLQLADCQQHRNSSCVGRFLDPLANFEASVAWHVDIEDDDVGLKLCDLLERRRTIIDRNQFVTSVREDAPAHVLGGYAVVGEQYSSCQGIFLW